MLMSLSLCLPPRHGGRDGDAGAAAGRALVQSRGASSSTASTAAGAPPAPPAGPAAGSGRGRPPIKVLAPPSASRKDACFLSRGGGTGVGFAPSRAPSPCGRWATVSGMLAAAAGPDSWGLPCALLIAGGGGRGGGDRGLSVPFASGGVRVQGRFGPPPSSWLCTLKNRGLIKHRAPLVWLHSSSEGVLVFIECTPFIRQS